RAGDRALSLLAYEEAARLYNVALFARPDAPTRCELLLARGEAESRAGRTPAAKETFVAAAEIARKLGLPKALAQAAVGYGGRIVWVRAADDTRLVPLLEEALAALPPDKRALRAGRLRPARNWQPGAASSPRSGGRWGCGGCWQWLRGDWTRGKP